MHELGLIKTIVESAEAAAIKAGVAHVKVLRLSVGQMTGLDPEQISFLFETYEKDPCLKDAKIEIEEMPVELECPECKHLFVDERFADREFAHGISHAPAMYAPPVCPKCNAAGPEVIRGQELNITGMEEE